MDRKQQPGGGRIGDARSAFLGMAVLAFLALLAVAGLPDGEARAAQTTPIPNCRGEFSGGCAYWTEDFPSCPVGLVPRYYRRIVSSDDTGHRGSQDCGCPTGPCSESWFSTAPDRSLRYAGIWIRMHDHEMSVWAELHAYRPDGTSFRATRRSINTSGPCEYGCSKHGGCHSSGGDQGCPGDLPEPGPVGAWFDDSGSYAGWDSRSSWPCAVSYAEHAIPFVDGGAWEGDVDQVQFRFVPPWPGAWGADEHVHIYDVVWVACVTPPPSPTPTLTPTRTPTLTPVPTPSAVTLSARYPRLVYRAPELGLPAQTLDVAVTGGAPPYTVTFILSPPGGGSYQLPYTAFARHFSYGAAESGDGLFGVSAVGTWRARAIVDNVPSNEVSWEVHWYPAHVVR